MYGDWYGRFQDRLEGAFDASIARFLSWTIPELKCLPNHRDRLAVMMILSSMNVVPRWRALPLSVSILLAVPWLCLRAQRWLAPQRSATSTTIVMLVIGVCAAVLIIGWVCYFVFLDRHRRAVYQILANLDESICPWCGYDLRGHLADTATRDITCPECGRTVPCITRTTPDPTVPAREGTYRTSPD